MQIEEYGRIRTQDGMLPLFSLGALETFIYSSSGCNCILILTFSKLLLHLLCFGSFPSDAYSVLKQKPFGRRENTKKRVFPTCDI